MRLLVVCFLVVLVFASVTILFIGSGSGIGLSEELVSVFQSTWFKVMIVLGLSAGLVLVSYPVIRQKIIERRVLRDLSFMAKHSQAFDWFNIEARATDCYYRFYSEWRKEDMREADLWLGEEFQKKHSQFVERLEKEGLEHICDIDNLVKVRPVYFLHRNVGSRDENSKLVLIMSAKIKSYLTKRITSRVFEGSKHYRNTHSLWSFELVNGKWVIADIEDVSAIGQYVKLANEVPEIEETLLKPVRILVAE